MRLILYTQYYRARTPDRQAELDHCLRSNLQHPALDLVVVLSEPDAPALPGPARMAVQQLELAERLTYANWMRLLRQEPDAIGILINADIALAEGFEQLEAVLNTPETALALSRYIPQADGQPARLNKFTHWTQDTWALRSDAPISDSLLYASGFPIGYPGCDNRIAYVLWSHGLVVKNPCYHLETLHYQADDNRHYDKNGDRLYGGVSYVHPSLSLAEPSELEHTLWTRNREPCPGVLVNQQAVEQGVHQLLAKDGGLAKQFLEQQKSTGLAWAHPPLGCSRSDHASTWTLQQLRSEKGAVLDLSPVRRLKSLQLRLPREVPGQWWLELEGRRQAGGSWQTLELGGSAELRSGGLRQFVELSVLHEPWQQLRLRLRQQPESLEPFEGLLELLTFAEKAEPPPAKAASKSPRAQPKQAATPGAQSAHRFKLKLMERRLEPSKELAGQAWEEIHRYSNRFVLQKREGRIAFVDRFWPTAVSFSDPELHEWNTEELREAFVWGFAGPVLEWKVQQFSTEKLYAEQLNFWQYPCRTEQDAFDRHQRMQAPYWDHEGVHVYVGMPWATWIDKKTFPDQLLEAYRTRIQAMRSILREPLQVHSVCQHIRWKEHPHRFEQAGINQLWIAHKEKGWDREGSLELHAWPLYAVNVLDPERREGLEIVPVEQKSIFASFKGAHMKHYPSDIRLRLKELAHLEGYEIEVTDLWHFNKVVYNYQIANKQSDKEADDLQEIFAYNRLLSQTLFSLCPGGAGPNTLRLWESLGIGAIPVVLSDRYEFPTIPFDGGCQADWQRAVVVIPEEEAHTAHERLGAIATDTARQMQRQCLEIHTKSLLKSCFSAIETATVRQPADPAPMRTLRALVIGSSVSIQKTGYLPMLKSMAERSYNTDLQLLNASLGGCSTQASLAYLKGELFYNFRAFNADIALIEKCPNERHLRFSQLKPQQQREHEEQVYRDTLELCTWCHQHNIRPILLCSYFRPGPDASWQTAESQGYLRRTYYKVAREAQVPLIDLHTSLCAEQDPAQLLLDDVHLNDAGSDVMARVVADALLGSLNLSDSNASQPVCAPVASDADLEVLFKGSTHTFTTRLLSASYSVISSDPSTSIRIAVEPDTELTGLFYISDQASSAITITPDGDGRKCHSLPLMDHMSFMPRVTYRKLTGLTAHKQFTISQAASCQVDISKTLDSYHNSRTFNPEDDWACKKYLQPLLEREQGKLEICEKIIAVFGRRSSKA